jgi:TPP-dependent pyruvate/acetoin dehydrogenase alpha subunit
MKRFTAAGEKIVTSTSISTYPTEKLLVLYRQMKLIREFELRAINERRSGLIPGFIHSCVGQEATAVGACTPLRKDDVITSTHRGHGHLIAKGGEPKYMMAELAARSTGYCGGKGGSLHMTDFDLGILGANGIVAGGIPMATGAALAFQMRGEDNVALAFFGDGAVNEGAFHEAANLAGLWRLPIIFMCENNLYGEGTPQDRQAPVADLSVRAAGYNFPGVVVDGNDVIAVLEATEVAIERARQGDGPTFVEGKTYRYRGHYEGDPMVYRSKEETEFWQQRDPIATFREKLITEKLASPVDMEAIDQEITNSLDEAVAFASSSPAPAPESAMEGVYGETHNGRVF